MEEIKYCMSKFATKSALESAIMADPNMSDMEKLARIFHNHKDEVKQNFPHLYYAILAVLDADKKPAPGSDYFKEE